jgi:hypothetical protein
MTRASFLLRLLFISLSAGLALALGDCATVPPPSLGIEGVTSTREGLYYYQLVITGDQLDTIDKVSLRFGEVSVPVQVMDKAPRKITGRILRKSFGTSKNVVLELQTEDGKAVSKDVSDLWSHEKTTQGEGDYQWF